MTRRFYGPIGIHTCNLRLIAGVQRLLCSLEDQERREATFEEVDDLRRLLDQACEAGGGKHRRPGRGRTAARTQRSGRLIKRHALLRLRLAEVATELRACASSSERRVKVEDFASSLPDLIEFLERVSDHDGEP